MKSSGQGEIPQPTFEQLMPLEQLIASYGEFIPFIHTKLDVVLYNAFPFNLLKGDPTLRHGNQFYVNLHKR